MSEDVLAERSKTLALDQWHRARGARMMPFAGYEMPIQYEGILLEHHWTRTRAGLFDVSHMGQVEIGGNAADSALEKLLPGDIAGLAPGRTRYSLLLADDGGILDDLMVTRLPSGGLFLIVNGATKDEDIAHIAARLPRDVTFTHLTGQALLALQGPEAATVLSRLVPGVEALTFMTGARFDWKGTPLWISRSGYTGEDGFEISVPGGKAAALADALCAEPEVKPIGLGARDSLRLEAGMPLYGHDLDPGVTPVTADLGFAIPKRRRAEGGFPGAARILGEFAQGPIQKRVGLLIEGRQPVREGALVLDGEGNEVGRVTSGGFSPTLERPIAMAYVPVAAATAGQTIQVEQRGKLFQATVTPLPFVPHRYHR